MPTSTNAINGWKRSTVEENYFSIKNRLAEMALKARAMLESNQLQVQRERASQAEMQVDNFRAATLHLEDINIETASEAELRDAIGRYQFTSNSFKLFNPGYGD